MADVFRAPTGTRDILPPESRRWSQFVADFATQAGRYGYELAITPVFEHLEVFARVGESTDIVRKEMYDFTDKGDRRLVLRPDGTAGAVRAYVQHRPTPPWKVWYVAPHFRYDRPQKGRYRQFFQVGVEAIGADDPAVDVEVIDLAVGFLQSLGLTDMTLSLNTLGDTKCRPAYLDALRDYLRVHAGELCADSQARMEQNPLRVLDCKRPECIAVTERAPQIFEHLCSECETHFEAVQRGLSALTIEHEIQPRLVRGLDYYTRTTFEIASGALESAQNALGGGGRYDLLAEEMGGDPTPAIGFALGIDRSLIACDAAGVYPTPGPMVDVFVVDMVGGLVPLTLLHDLRVAGLAADRAYGGRSAKAQFKKADASGARFAVVVGATEIERGVLSVRDLAASTQEEVAQDYVIPWLLERKETLA
jgi:histidyl-tRNA synthetase